MRFVSQPAEDTCARPLRPRFGSVDARLRRDYSKSMLIRVPAIVMLAICLLAQPMAFAQPGLVDPAASAAGALGRELQTDLVPSARTAPRLSSDEAAREIQRRHGGRILSVQPDGLGYRVKVLKNGEVRIYQINP